MIPKFTVLSVPAEGETTRSARAERDLLLVDAALSESGQAKAYEALLQHYRKSVYHTVLKMVRNPDDADDLTLEIFAKAFRNLPCYRPDYAFSTWLFRIATNHCIDFLRRQHLKTLSLQSLLPTSSGEEVGWELTDPDPTPQETLIRQQRVEVARQVVDLLPPKYARLARLRYFDERSYEEIATELQLPIGTVKAQLFRARELMLELLHKSKASF